MRILNQHKYEWLKHFIPQISNLNLFIVGQCRKGFT